MEQVEFFVQELSQGTPEPSGVITRGLGTPSPTARGLSNVSGLSDGSLSPLPLIRKHRKPVSVGTSPSGLPPPPKMRSVRAQSVEPIDLVSVDTGGVDLIIHQGIVGEEELGGDVSVEEEWECGSSTTDGVSTVLGVSEMDQDVKTGGMDRDVGTGGAADTVGASAELRVHDGTVRDGTLEALNLHVDPIIGASSEIPGQGNVCADSAHGLEGLAVVGSLHRVQAAKKVYAPRPPKFVLSVLEKNMVGETTGEHRSFA